MTKTEYVEVRTQAELDAALARPNVVPVCIGAGSFVARESSSVVARESSRVVAWGSSSVEARESSSVVARESSSVVAWESSRVEAWGSSRVEAWGSSRVVAWESSRVEARESSRVEARGSSRVVASKYVAIQRHGTAASVSGGVLIQIPTIATVEEWCDYYGAKVERGVAMLYKALGPGFESSHGMTYMPGSQPEAPDWDGGGEECGGGLHFSPSAAAALEFHPDAERFVACPVRVADIVVHKDAIYPQKVKAPRVCGPVVEVDRFGAPVPTAKDGE